MCASWRFSHPFSIAQVSVAVVLRYLIDAALIASGLLPASLLAVEDGDSFDLGVRVFAYAVVANLAMYCCAYFSTIFVATLHFHYAFTCVRMHHNEAYCMWKASSARASLHPPSPPLPFAHTRPISATKRD